MAWIATDQDGMIHFYAARPIRSFTEWRLSNISAHYTALSLEAATEMLNGQPIPTWEDVPVEIVERPQEG